MRRFLVVLASIAMIAALAAAGPTLAEQSKPAAKPTTVDRKGAAEPQCLLGKALCDNQNVEGVKSSGKGKATK